MRGLVLCYRTHGAGLCWLVPPQLLPGKLADHQLHGRALITAALRLSSAWLLQVRSCQLVSMTVQACLAIQPASLQQLFPCWRRQRCIVCAFSSTKASWAHCAGLGAVGCPQLKPFPPENKPQLCWCSAQEKRRLCACRCKGSQGCGADEGQLDLCAPAWQTHADMPGCLQVAEWLVERAKAVEQTTGQLGLCARLLKQALAQAEAAEGAFAPQAQQLTDSIKELQAAMRAGRFCHLPWLRLCGPSRHCLWTACCCVGQL